MESAISRPRPARRVRWSVLDVLLIGTVFATTLFLTARQVPLETAEWPAAPKAKFVVYGTLQGIGWLLWLACRHAGSRVVTGLARSTLLVLSTLLTVGAVHRYRASFGYVWPPKVTRHGTAVFAAMAPRARTAFAVRVAMHRLSTAPTDTVIRIPDAWPYPSDVVLAVERGARDSVRVWARSADTVVACAEYPQDFVEGSLMLREQAYREHAPCQGHRPPPREAFAAPARVAGALIPPLEQPSGDSAWPQHRHDARHGAAAGPALAASRATGWSAHIDGEVRSSASVIGDLVFLGTHGSGSLAAFDLETGAHVWTRRVPNWIHHDAVGDGRVVVVGFGDNMYGSFAGAAPSGVAAFDTHSGRHRWTVFDESSVMTSPVLFGDAIVYGTATGEIHKRRLADGLLMGTTVLPGGVIMGPPAMSGDTLVVSLDPGAICALLMSSMKTLWCRDIAGFAMTGHHAPSLVDGRVLIAGIVTASGVRLREFVSMPWSLKLAWLRTTLLPHDENVFGQRLVSLRMDDGALQWTGELRAATKRVSGHPAGSAAISEDGKVGVIVYPIQDSLVAFDVASGAVRWSKTAGGSRGAPLVMGSHVFHVGRSGVLSVLRLDTGGTRCVYRRRGQFDRAGPTYGGGRLIVASTVGNLSAIPAAQVSACAGADDATADRERP